MTIGAYFVNGGFVELHGVDLSYDPDGGVLAVRGLDLSIGEGEFIAEIGRAHV